MTTVETSTNLEGCPPMVIDHTLYIRVLLKDQVRQYVEDNFGERCDPVIPDDAPPCGCCEAWKAYDTLFGWEDDE